MDRVRLDRSSRIEHEGAAQPDHAFDVRLYGFDQISPGDGAWLHVRRTLLRHPLHTFILALVPSGIDFSRIGKIEHELYSLSRSGNGAVADYHSSAWHHRHRVRCFFGRGRKLHSDGLG